MMPATMPPMVKYTEAFEEIRKLRISELPILGFWVSVHVPCLVLMSVYI